MAEPKVAPGSKPMPTPKGTPAPTNDVAPVTTPGQPTPAPDAGGPVSSPVSAEAAASAAQQAALAAEAAEAVAAAPGKEDTLVPAAKEPAELKITPPEFSVQETGNSTFDEVGKILLDKGIKNVNEILDQAAEGQISLENQAALVAELGEGVAALLLKNLQTEMTSIKTEGSDENKRIKNYAAELFGAEAANAEEVWSAMNNFANSEESGLNEADRTALNKMLAAGGSQAEMALREVASRYERSQGFTKVPDLIQGDRGTQSGFQPLTKQDYQKEIGPAIRQFGEDSAEVNSLRNRRMASQKRGF